MAEKTYTILYNIEKRQPGCVLLQAGYGATVLASKLWNDLFFEDFWNLSPEGMKLYAVTESQLRLIAEKSVRNAR